MSSNLEFRRIGDSDGIARAAEHLMSVIAGAPDVVEVDNSVTALRAALEGREP